ncbi:vacuolar alkaline phosphatase [Tieghemiomyces parasiticus]|uniref:Alkaline phosphatase n=1 Tax=Tieghemiomyces parasiticus TaxID=78921 RepID=A0A9W7ZNU7_9FUNG|nr:vacuolar alkaline phosphatase [Tieghemiomyces parasiticus]
MREGPIPKVRNVILMISDGFGPASETLARTYHRTVNKLPDMWQSPLDDILVGTMRTHSASSHITDSAAGATAFACGRKTYNDGVGVTPDQAPCGTVLEAAKAAGLRTGLVVTSRITHATPAAFSAHVVHRDMEDLIAQQQIGDYALGRSVDLLFGGGLCHFLPNTVPDSCRVDSVDLLARAQNEHRFTTLASESALNDLDPDGAQLPLLGLFASDNMAYEIDRPDSGQPSLSQMTAKALDILQAASHDQPEGFFLMVEGSRIDMAAHCNDPATQVREVAAYWDTVRTVKNFVNQHPADTLLISTSDHETGGLSVGVQLNSTYPDYVWYPERLQPVQRSAERVALDLWALPLTARLPVIRERVPGWLGIADPTEEELTGLAKEFPDWYALADALALLISRRAQVGWSTHGHSGVDVNVYAHGVGAESLRGNRDNTDIGKHIARVLNLDLQSVTNRLRNDVVYQANVDDPHSPINWRRTDMGHSF